MKTNNFHLKIVLLASTVLLTYCGDQKKSGSQAAQENSEPVPVVTTGSTVLTPEEIQQKTAAQSAHGFGFNLTASQIPAVLDASKVPASVASAAEVAAVKAKPAPSTIYSGRSLSLENCVASGFGSGPQAQLASQAFPSGAKHLGEILTQTYLLELFAPGENWFQTALMSLEEQDPSGGIRPRDPVHPYLLARLGEAVDPGPEFWKLAAVSFRVGERATSQSSAVAEMPIVGQIKIDYILDGRTAKAHTSIISASIIHSIAIFPKYYDEFIYHLLSIRQDVSVSGCDVFKVIDWALRNNGNTIGNRPRSFYFFAHTNIFDDFAPIPVHEWRFTELKPVVNDTLAKTRMPVNLANVTLPTGNPSGMAMATFDESSGSSSSAKDTYGTINQDIASITEQKAKYLEMCKAGNWLVDAAANSAAFKSFSTAELAARAACPTKATADEVKSCLAQAALNRCNLNVTKVAIKTNRITSPYENVMAPTADLRPWRKYPLGGRALRIVRMLFTPSQITSDTSATVIPRPDLSFEVYFSGTVTDCSANQLTANDPIPVGEPNIVNPSSPKVTNCRLLVNADGSRARPDHLAFADEKNHTCAGCHMGRAGLTAVGTTSKLSPIGSMNKQHISNADGGNRSGCNPFFDQPRSENQVSLSPYFLEFANGYKMNQYASPATNAPGNAAEGVFAAGDTILPSGEMMFNTHIDQFRCFSRTMKPGEKLN